MNQKDVRKHIEAAKGWLKQADDSLEQENDIQGDLKLMLAQAELKRAQEKNDTKLCVRYFKRLAPAMLACLLALGGILYVQAGRQEQPGVAPPVAEQPRAVLDMVQKGGLQEEPAAEGPALPEPPAEEVQEGDLEPQELQTLPQAIENDDDISQQPQPENKPELPAPELQKLMQSAGSILRE